MSRAFILVLLIASFRFVDLGYSEMQYMDEGMHTSWARAVAEHGNWLDQRAYPVFEYPARLYPPVFMWVDALAFRTFGVSEPVARIFPAAAGFFMVIVVYAFGRALGGPSLGVWMALLVGLDQHVTHYSRTAMLEAPYLLFLMAASLCHLRGLEGRGRRWPLLAGISFGLALMTKGAVALIFPAAAVLHAAALKFLPSRERGIPSGALAARNAVVASAIGFCIAAPWHLYMIATQGKGFVYDYFWFNLVERIQTGYDMPIQPLGPLHYFNQLPIALPIVLPFFIAAVAWIVGSFRRNAKGDAEPSPRIRVLVAGMLFVAWFVTAFVLFSITECKPDQYLFPIVVPVLVLAAIEANAAWVKDGWSRRSIAVAAIPFMLFWSNGMPFRMALKRIISSPGATGSTDATDRLVVFGMAGGLVLLTVAALWIQRTRPARIRPRRMLPPLVVLLAFFVAYRTFVVEPKLYASGAPQVAERLREGPIGHLTITRPTIETPIIYYLGVPDATWQTEHIALVDSKTFSETVGGMPRGPGEYVLVNRVDFKDVDRWGRAYFGETLAAFGRTIAPYGRMVMETKRYQLWELVP